MLLPSYYNVWFIIILLPHGALPCFIVTFYLYEDDSNKKKRTRSVMVIGILKNLSYRYSSHYIIKILGFILIYYVINLDIVLYFFSNLYFKSIELLQI